jgi:hypothetical protein
MKDPITNNGMPISSTIITQEAKGGRMVEDIVEKIMGVKGGKITVNMAMAIISKVIIKISK